MTTRTAILNGVSGIAFGLMLGLAAPVAAQEATDDPCAGDGLSFLEDANSDCAGTEPDFLSDMDDSGSSEELDFGATEEEPATDDSMAASEEPAEEPVEEESAAAEDPTLDDESLITSAEGDGATDGMSDEMTDGETAAASGEGDAGLEGESTETASDDPIEEDTNILAGADGDATDGAMDGTDGDGTETAAGTSDAELDALFGDGFTDGDTAAAGEEGLEGDGTETASDDPIEEDTNILAGADDGSTSGSDGDLTDPNLASGSVGGDAEDPGVDDSLEIAADDDGNDDNSSLVSSAANNGLIIISAADAGDPLIGLGVSPDLSQLITIGDPSNLDSLVDVGVLAPAGDQAALVNATVADGLDSGIESLVGVDLGGDSMLGNNNNLVQLTLGSTFAPLADALAGQTTLLAPLKPILDLGVQN